MKKIRVCGDMNFDCPFYFLEEMIEKGNHIKVFGISKRRKLGETHAKGRTSYCMSREAIVELNQNFQIDYFFYESLRVSNFFEDKKNVET